MKNRKELSRRDFIKGMAAFGAAGLTSAAMLKAPVSASAEESTDIHWDKEADVVVVGTGTVITAAIAANEFGADKVIILEKNPVLFGGTSMMSGGGFALPGYIDDLKEEGIEDSREKVLTYMHAVGEDRMPAEPQEAFVDHANEFCQWLKGVFGFSRFGHYTKAHGDYYENYAGSIGYGRGNVGIFNADGELLGASDLWNIYHEYVDQHDNMELLFGCEGKNLITDSTGAVIGIYGEQDGKTLAIRARKGLVLGTGGFDYNEQMRKYFLPFPIYRSCSSVMNTGDGHRMGARIGGQLAFMDRVMGVPFVYDEVEWNEDDDRNYSLFKNSNVCDWSMFCNFPHSCIVNRKGKRFMNEAREYDTFIRAFSSYDTGAMKFENIPAFFIADTQYVSKYILPGYGTPFAETGLPEYVKVFDTIEELADGMGIKKENLLHQLETFNENARKGVDPEFHRGESEDAYQDLLFAASMCSLTGDVSDLTDRSSTLGTVEVGPFYCIRYVPGTCGTRGGLLTDGEAQVLNTDGEKIPGLYAVGSCSSGVAGYWAGGACIAQGSVMSYIAVKSMMNKD